MDPKSINGILANDFLQRSISSRYFFSETVNQNVWRQIRKENGWTATGRRQNLSASVH